VKTTPTFLALLVAAASAASIVSVALGSPPEDNVFASHLMVDQDVIVSARITGIVESITVDRGSAVTQGQTLATLDPRALDADVREAKEDMDLRKAEYDRAQSLVDSKVGSVQDLDSKKAQWAVAVARWEKTKTQRDRCSAVELDITHVERDEEHGVRLEPERHVANVSQTHNE